jgi:copper chaperone NosL
MPPENKISNSSRALLVLAAITIVVSIFLPIWRIDLFAPQYPEGLALLIYADKLAGDVDIINGLNHYIGMQTLHAENFVEFTVLKYILGFFSLLILMTALIGNKKLVYTVFIIFTIFSLLSMADFYRWNYNYGHHLDPNAAIKVPGMSYQPPILGYKQLLNFGAYSMPDSGGWFFIGTGILLLLVTLMERKVFAKWFKRKPAVAVILMLAGITLTACSAHGPRPIQLNKDACAYCKMSITEASFATQMNTVKGRDYVFDDLVCMASYIKENNNVEMAKAYVANFCTPTEFVDLDDAVLIHSDSLRSPMGGNIAGFASEDSASVYKSRFAAREITWASILQ